MNAPNPAQAKRKPPKPPHFGSWAIYEQVKSAWIAAHPEATPAQYQAAMAAICKKCRV